MLFAYFFKVDSSGAATPSWKQRVVMIFGHAVFPFLIERIFTKLENLLAQERVPHLSSKQQDFLLQALPKCKYILVTLHHLHLSVFYLQNIFHAISKRLSGVHYTKYFRNIPTADMRFNMLGYVQLAQNLLMLSMQVYGLYCDFRRVQNKGADSYLLHHTDGRSNTMEPHLTEKQMSCSLCFEKRSFSSATPCGHLFCYYCIHNWMETKAECPVCRQNLDPREIVLLRNL